MGPYQSRYLTLLLLLGAAFVVWSGMFRDGRHPEHRVTPEAVWQYIERRAPAYGLEPGFVYAVVKAESTFNPHAETAVARGLMQMTAGAWKTVSNQPYREAWNWRSNLDAGMAYLAHLKAQLEAAERFSYPRLAAAYRFGPNRLREADYNLSRMPATQNRIYTQLFSGNTAPVSPP